MRKARVAGSFYPAERDSLLSMVKGFIGSSRPKASRIVVAPHAGYVYSGACAGLSFAAAKKSLSKKDATAIILCPNHTGNGLALSISSQPWETPIGIVEPDHSAIDLILRSNYGIRKDELAHANEHSGEVMLPFIQAINPSARLVCICMGYQDISFAERVAKAILPLLRDERFTLIASSDFSHFLDSKSAEKADHEAIQKILGMDPEGFSSLVEKKDLSICGHGPIIAAMLVARELGCSKPVLNCYTDSGKSSGDLARVVGYASMSFLL